MAFWTRVRGELKKAAQEGWEAVKGGTKAATNKGEELAKTGKLRYKVRAKHKEAEKLFAELGGVVYEMSTPPAEDIFSKSEVERLIDTIKAVEDEIAVIEEEIEAVKVSHVVDDTADEEGKDDSDEGADESADEDAKDDDDSEESDKEDSDDKDK
ncbi:MAG: hypothetical protein KAS88_03995 [Deltaproteobacteria bacterium]|nr:hypothetical protein [Deltaproteobacteria bacterium]